MRNTKPLYVLKYTVYTMVLLLLYVLQQTPGFFVIFGVKPIWVIPAAIAIAMYEGELTGGIYGAFAGLLCDMGGLSIFGFNGFFVCVCCIITGLLVIYLMRCNLLGCLLFVFITQLLRGSLGYLFAYGMWGYEDAWRIYATQTLPVAVFSTLVAPLTYYLIRALHLKFQAVL